MLGLVRVPSARRGIDAARAVLRMTGRGHSAAIHSTDPGRSWSSAATVEVLRVSVNVGNSLGSAGLETNLAPSMTIGTGFFGRSSLGENLQPKHLVQWTRMAYNREAAEPFGNFSGLVPWEAPAGACAAVPGGLEPAGRLPAGPSRQAGQRVHACPFGSMMARPDSTALREEIRRVVIEELAQLARG